MKPPSGMTKPGAGHDEAGVEHGETGRRVWASKAWSQASTASGMTKQALRYDEALCAAGKRAPGGTTRGRLITKHDAEDRGARTRGYVRQRAFGIPLRIAYP